MNAVVFDTHRMVKQLVAAGFTDQQAESVTDVVSAARGFDVETLATKAELGHEIGLQRAESRQGFAEVRREMAELRAELKQEIAELRAELKQEVAELRAELKQEVAELRAELQQEVAKLRAELKQDIADLRAELKQEIAELRVELKQDIGRLDAKIAETKTEILRWVIGIAIAQTGLLITLLRFVPGH